MVGRRPISLALSAGDIGIWRSPMHSGVVARSVRPRQGDVFLRRSQSPTFDRGPGSSASARHG
ncbi:MAG: hypothetical protein V3S87_01605, partial [Alphaproteobacteria bacterium]